MNSGGLYIISGLSFEDGIINARLSLDGRHWLFSSHFPGQPILPGAMLAEIVSDLCSRCLKRQFVAESVEDARFKRPVVPLEGNLLSARISVAEEKKAVRAKASFTVEAGAEKSVAATLSVSLAENKFPVCFLVPFYNNSKTVAKVIESIQGAGFKVVAVNDGSTDNESLDEALKANPYELVSYERNKGKGYALRQGFKRALSLGFKYAMVFDADGQHTISGARAVIDKSLSLGEKEMAKTIVVGSRNKRGADGGGKFANNFSNFWLTVQTGRKVGDTQSGMRLYPLEKICKTKFLGNRYEFETEVLVRMAWRGFRLLEVPVDVVYPEDRVTHFRKGADFTRISLMNTFLTCGALLYGYPRMFFHRIFR